MEWEKQMAQDCRTESLSKLCVLTRLMLSSLWLFLVQPRFPRIWWGAMEIKHLGTKTWEKTEAESIEY